MQISTDCHVHNINVSYQINHDGSLPEIAPGPSSTLSIASQPSSSGLPDQRPTKRRRVLPTRLTDFEMHDDMLRDVLPQAPLSIPSASSTLLRSSVAAPDANGSADPDVPHTLMIKVLDSALNSFSVFRCYHSAEYPSHDPDAHANLSNLTTVASIRKSATLESGVSDFHPYPNQSAFLL